MKKRVLLLLTMMMAVVCFYNIFNIKSASAQEIGTDTGTPAATVTYISITQNPTKVVYSQGENLDLTGLVLLAYYSDGSAKVTTDYTTSGFNSNVVGTQSVILNYQGFSTYFTVTVNPSKVTGVTCSSYTSGSVTLNWNYINGALRYEIYTYNPVDGSRVLSFISNTNSITLNYPPAFIFSIQICAVVNYSGVDYRSGFSDPFTGATAPTGAVGLSVATTTAKTVSLSWSPVTGATGYVIYRSSNSGKDFSVCATSATTAYLDEKVSSGTAYQYKVFAYVYSKNYIGEASNVVDVTTYPDKMLVKCKPGEQKIRITWNKITGASYYDIYMSNVFGAYNLLTTRKASSTCAYVVDGLITGQTYYVYAVARRNYNGVEYKGESSDVATVTVTEIAATSTDAKIFLTKDDFLNSESFTDIDFFQKNVKYSKSVVMPGLITANVDGFVSTTMCPQAITFAGNYLLQTAYDMNAEENSVIFVIDKTTKQLLTTLVLPSKTHAGGIAFDGYNIWISNGTKVSSIMFEQLEAAIAAGTPCYKVTFDTTIPLGITASYVTFYDDRLWVGSYDELKTTYMNSYTIQNMEGIPDLLEQESIVMPTRVQGVSFTLDGILIVSRSCQLYQGLRGYMRQLDLYRPDLSKVKDGMISLGKVINTVTMPSMNEGIAIDGSYLYVNYESAAFDKATYKMDRICAFKLSALTPKAS